MGRILIVRLSSLGDIILTQPAIAAAQRAGHHVDLAVHPDYVALGKLLPGVDRVLCSKVEFAKQYDIVFDLHATWRARRFIREVKTGRLIRVQKHSLQRRLMVRPQGRPRFWNAWSRLRPDEQVLQWYAKAMVQAGIQVNDALPQVEMSEWAHQSAAQTLARFSVKASDRLLVLAPGAKWKAKQWPVEYFAQAAQHLEQSHGLVPVFVGSMGERKLCEQAAAAAGGRAFTIAGLTNLPALAAVCSRSDVLIANDSGTMHLGLASGTLAVALFGPTVGAFGFAPRYHPRAKVLEREGLACRPCSVHGGNACPLGHHDCMRRLTVAEVCSAVAGLLEENPRKRMKAEGA